MKRINAVVMSFSSGVGDVRIGLREGKRTICVGRCMPPHEISVKLTGADIGRVVEVEYTAVNDFGIIVAPEFVRWRDDAGVSDCLLSQDPELVRVWGETEDRPQLGG